MSEFCGPLMKEQEFFASNLNSWLPDHSSEWVWVNGNEFSFHKTYKEAIESAHTAGYIKEAIFIEEVSEGYQTIMFPGRIFI